MAIIRELERGGWLDESVPNKVRHEVEGLCHLLAECLADLVVSLSMFEHAYALSLEQGFDDIDHEEWQREALRHREREAELRAAADIAWDDPNHWEKSKVIRDQAAREILREKWQRTGGPEHYRRRVIFIHAKSFVTTLATLQRCLSEMCGYCLDSAVTAKLEHAQNAFSTALPGLKDVRDSIAHVDERIRGVARRKTIAAKPIHNTAIHAPNGGTLVVGILNNQHFGCTLADGTYAEVEIADATTEIARRAVQAVFDALPWRPGHRFHEPAR